LNFYTRLLQEVFRVAGFPCPLYTNPADHILDVITPPKSDPTNTNAPLSVEQQAANDQAIIDAQPPLHVDLTMGEQKRLAQMAGLQLNPSWDKQVRVLFHRNLREQSRKLHLLGTSILQTIVMAILIGTVFLRLSYDEVSAVKRRESVLFFCAINQGVFGALTVINSFPVERTLTLRERASGTYFASAYFVAKIFSDTMVQLPIPIIFVSILFSPLNLLYLEQYLRLFVVAELHTIIMICP
jgi:ATP-binding cassette, subfamily G (WHITE), member 2